MAGASLPDDVSMSILSVYLVKKMHDGQMESAGHSNWSIYEMANIPYILDPMGSPFICL